MLTTKYIKFNSELYIFSESKKQGSNYAPYYLAKMKPNYEYITGMFCVDKSKNIFQGKSRDGKKYIYKPDDDNLIVK